MSPEEIKRYFESFPPPKEVQWKPWATITDSQVFLNSCYTGIKNFNGNIERCPAWWHLKDFYLLVKSNAPKVPQQEDHTETESES